MGGSKARERTSRGVSNSRAHASHLVSHRSRSSISSSKFPPPSGPASVRTLHSLRSNNQRQERPPSRAASSARPTTAPGSCIPNAAASYRPKTADSGFLSMARLSSIATNPTLSASCSASNLLTADEDGIPLGLSEMDAEELEVYVDIIKEKLEDEKASKAARRRQRTRMLGGDNSMHSGPSMGSETAGLPSERCHSAADSDVKRLSKTHWFERSRVSKINPLRSLLLDPTINNIPPAKTHTELVERLRTQNIPHPSFDVDGDGVVSQEDYAMAKRFDLDGNGQLDEAEAQVGRRIMAERFFMRHPDDLHLYGGSYSQQSLADNINQLAKSKSFKKTMSELLEREQHHHTTGSDSVKQCMTLQDSKLTRHNFFADKMNTTAWNDFTRDPRHPTWLASKHHSGSRHQLEFMRKAEARERAQELLNLSWGPELGSCRRIQLITRTDVENS